MTIGQFECYVAACGEPAQARELPPPATPDMGHAAAGERFRIEVLGPPRHAMAAGRTTTARVHAP
jgi:hypothetical protein